MRTMNQIISSRESARRYYRKKCDYLKQYKSSRCCCACGEDDVACLDLHHINDNKNYRLIKDGRGSRKARWQSLPWDELFEELEKVEVLCANCHRKLHRDERGV